VEAARFLHCFGETCTEVRAAGDDLVERCAVVRLHNDDFA